VECALLVALVALVDVNRRQQRGVCGEFEFLVDRQVRWFAQPTEQDDAVYSIRAKGAFRLTTGARFLKKADSFPSTSRSGVKPRAALGVRPTPAGGFTWVGNAQDRLRPEN